MLTDYKEKRNINLDLLRIISMLLIILLHTIDHSGILEIMDTLPVGIRFIERFQYAVSQICVNSFVMISGYFLVKSCCVCFAD